ARMVFQCRQRLYPFRSTHHPLIESRQQPHNINGLGGSELINILSQHPEAFALDRNFRCTLTECGQPTLRVALVNSPPARTQIRRARRSVCAQVLSRHPIERLVSVDPRRRLAQPGCGMSETRLLSVAGREAEISSK